MQEIIITPKDFVLDLSEELLEKYKIDIDENQIEQIIMQMPEEENQTLALEEKVEYVKRILNFDVSDLIKNWFDNEICFISKA